VRAFRIFLLILFVVLLPLRGAYAMERQCAPATGAVGAVQMSGHVHHDASLTSGSHGHHGSAGAADHDDHGHSGSGGHCNFCPACGGIAGPIALPTVPAPPNARTVFSRLDAPPAHFVAERLERPPRTA
jgi:hypothetical protein